MNRDHSAPAILVSYEVMATFGADYGKARASKGGQEILPLDRRV